LEPSTHRSLLRLSGSESSPWQRSIADISGSSDLATRARSNCFLSRDRQLARLE